MGSDCATASALLEAVVVGLVALGFMMAVGACALLWWPRRQR